MAAVQVNCATLAVEIPVHYLADDGNCSIHLRSHMAQYYLQIQCILHISPSPFVFNHQDFYEVEVIYPPFQGKPQ